MLRSILIVFATIMVLSGQMATAATAQRDLTWSKSGGWIIAMDPGDNCAMVSSFTGDWIFGVAYSVERKPVTLLNGPMPYKAGDNPDLQWTVGPDSFSGGDNVVSMYNGKPRVSAAMPAGFLGKIAVATSVGIYDEEDEEIASFTLEGTEAAVTELRRCWAELIKEDKGTRLPAVTAAKPLNLATLILPEDYPAAPLRAGISGRTGVALTITAHGLVSDCAIIASAGHPDLDTAACRILRSRARFTPAQDAGGKATEGRHQTGVSWTVPAD